MIRNIARILRSVWDYVIFFEWRLARHPVLMLCLLGVVGAIALGNLVFGYQDWTWVALLVALVAFVAKSGLTLVQSNRPRTPHFVLDERAAERAFLQEPTRIEAANGFLRYPMHGTSFGSVVLSDDFNVTEVSNPDVDWNLQVLPQGDTYDGILAHIRLRSGVFRAFAIKTMLAQIWLGKALTNETKVGLRTDLVPNLKDVRIYRTDYFAGLCTVELSAYSIVHKEGARNIVDLPSSERDLSKMDGTDRRLPRFADAVPAASLHFGVEVLAVSSDGVFRIPNQSRKTMVSRGMYAPLASGSVDWEDYRPGMTLKDLIVAAGQRELLEEWGAGKTARDLIKRIEVIGYFRNAMRGGKPQFVCLARLACPDHKLIADTSEVEEWDDPSSTSGSPSMFAVSTVDDLAEAVSQLLTRTGSLKSSVPLFGALHCLRAVCKRNPDRVAGILDLGPP